MNTHNLTRLFLLTTFLLLPIHVFANDQVKLLEQQALDYLSVHYNKSKPDVRTQININPISRSINLKKCMEPIQFQLPKGTGSRITLKAQCASPLWQIFITAKIQQFAYAVVSSQIIPKKKSITSSHIELKEVDTTNLRSIYFTSTADLIGWTAKRNIAPNTIITSSLAKPPLAVRKGYAVIIEAHRNGISIKASGTALEDGEIGKQIRVKNDRSGRVIKAEVIKPGLVRTP